MGNTESVSAGGDRPGPLMEEAKRNITMGFYTPACVKYRRAYELFKEAGATASAARALRLAAETGLQNIEQPDYELAAKAFEEVGKLNLDNVVTATLAPSAFANVIFCLLACGRAATAREQFEEFKKLCVPLAADINGLAVETIMEAYVNGNRNQTRNRAEGFKDACSNMPAWRETLLDKLVERL
jgi:hypothetical protein